MRLRLANPSDIGRGMYDRMSVQIESCRPAAIEHVNKRRIANAIERAVKRNRVVHAQFAHVGLADRHIEIVMRHGIRRS